MARRVKPPEYQLGQHVQVKTLDGVESGQIIRLPVPPSDVLLNGSPYYVLNVFDVETFVEQDEILGVIPDVRDPESVEAWLSA